MIDGKVQESQFSWKKAAALAGFALVIGLLWNSWVIFPFKILVVFFHELSHAAAALATGGQVDHVEIVAAQGGVCWTAGGNRFLILSAGYLGSLIWGGVLLQLSSRTQWDRAAAATLGALLLLASLIWVRPFFSFGFAATMLTGLAIAGAAAALPAGFSDGLLKAIGLTSVLYAALDIQQDILARPTLQESDAARLAELTGIPTLLWGLLWFAASLAGAAVFLSASCRETRQKGAVFPRS